jgi:glycosyltransferase involved in cell wall biosynthesis
MFVFPSLWEGFGLPIIEAMRCGAPVITSNISCMPEVAGEAALLVDPYSVDEIAAAMVRLHNEPDLRQRLRAQGLVRGAEFSWERCARETLAAYRDVWARTRARG